MRSLLLKTLVISTSTLSFIACSGGGGGGSAAGGDGFGSTTSAQFIDAPVKGLTFKNASGATGTTAAAGKFTCARGEVVSFELKGFKLGSAPCGDKIFVQDLFAPAVGGNGFTWAKAASVIQSFATGSSELDVTAANSSAAVDLSTVDYSGGFGNLSARVTAAAAGGVTGISHKNVATATTAADQSLADNAVLETPFAAALDLFIADQDAKGEFIVKAALVSGTKIGGDEWCDQNVEAQMKVTKTPVNTKSIYALETVKAISYDDAGDVNPDMSCIADTKCTDVDPKMIPHKKIITGSKFDVASAAPEIIDYRGQEGFNISSNTIVSMSASAAVDGIKVSGTFYNDFTMLNSATGDWAPYAGQMVKCIYKIK